MDKATQVALARQALALLEARSTALAEELTYNPVSNYTSPQRLQRERQVLFRQHPLVMGFSSLLREPGDYLTDDLSGVPVLVVRNAEGGINAFLNVCRHRGSRVASGSGNAGRAFVCPYHAWAYGLDGRLAGLPDRQSFAALDRSSHGLRPLPAAEHGGLIWVRPTPGGTIDLDSHLAGLAPELAGYGFAAYHHYEQRTLRHRMNWKIAVDTFLEPYHFGFLHRNTVGPIFVPNVCLFEPFGHNLRETFPRRSIVELKDKPEREWDLLPYTAIVYVLFPNTVVVMQIDHLECWRIYPAADRVDECVIVLDFFIPEPAESEKARGHWDRNMDLVIKVVEEEDFPTGEGIQFGFASGANEHVVYGRNEPALAHFERQVAAALGEDLDAARPARSAAGDD